MTRLSYLTLALAYIAPVAGYFADDHAAPYLFAAGIWSAATAALFFITND